MSCIIGFFAVMNNLFTSTHLQATRARSHTMHFNLHLAENLAKVRYNLVRI
ncbi:hypothetical protein Q7Y95_10580 [Glaesserella parasuis]|uniref:hypothetical protein n=1 Tax=Glaesserella parasuis TaxID=738 RepID=UPI0021BEB96B|nr:hypothetical protein [Glaesserella parasuis]MCT8550568.1 hypothetical protein [Glaesserella parasuis]MDG6452573.1 hypothetical protein [Glaesserella parasuis]MDO9926822.1 hypothetical protein [Glaesserella parasuis]MDO9982711.1 hypothetical protein [Glaesserella parasuis]MDP0061229.1 hypothetical protein [Glaesserella parasuis]